MAAPAPKPGTGSCLVCGEHVPSVELVDHLRVMHPDRYQPLRTWRDGQPVVIDETNSVVTVHGIGSPWKGSSAPDEEHHP
ncbi:hypothetical protein [Pseudonocardia alni]|uniref:hypothetical protein n=1 Tax=Pseudonocardia alni TaxID=33907 RepID=UPI00280BCBEA|nr:hypothetical protein [Pseudonocardia alni]